MYIYLTPEENKKMNHIRRNLYGETAAIMGYMAKDETGKLSDYMASLKKAAAEENRQYKAYKDKCDNARFIEIEAQGRQAIIDSAKDQISVIMRVIFEAAEQNQLDRVEMFCYREKDAGQPITEPTDEDLEGMRDDYIRFCADGLFLATPIAFRISKGKVLLYQTAVKDFIDEQIKLHLAALCDDQPGLGEISQAYNDTLKTYADRIIEKTPAPAFPEVYKRSADKVTSLAFSKSLTDYTPILRRSGKKKGEQLAVIRISPSDVSKQLNRYDDEIYNCFISLYAKGNKTITAKAIYSVLCGKRSNHPAPRQIDDIMESIEKMQFTKVDLQSDNKHIIMPVLPCIIGTAEMNGKIVEGTITALSDPPLYVYSNYHNQLSTFPIEINATPVNNDRETIIMRGLLQNRIAAMTYGNKYLSNKILYSAIYDAAGLPKSASRTQKNRVRKKCNTILTYWKRCEIISDYAEYPLRSQQKAGIMIEVSDQRKNQGKPVLIAKKDSK